MEVDVVPSIRTNHPLELRFQCYRRVTDLEWFLWPKGGKCFGDRNTKKEKPHFDVLYEPQSFDDLGSSSVGSRPREVESSPCVGLVLFLRPDLLCKTLEPRSGPSR